ncbi:hypothetical protein ACVIN2_002792 [Bradyrhizobium sp. USDA 3650]
MAMCNGHDRAFVRTRGDLEVRRAGLIELDNERMVAPDAKWKGEVLEQPKAIMRYVRGPAVHRATCTRDTSAENAANTLVSEADAENREPPRKFADDGGRYSGFRWRAWTGGDNDCARLEANKIAEPTTSFRNTSVA